MNRITDDMQTGAVGEMLVQLRLLEHGVQAAPPIKDSGNDLIAVRDGSFRAIQVKTTTTDNFDKPKKPRRFHILAVVQLKDNEKKVYLDRSPVFLIPFDRVSTVSTRIANLGRYRITRDRVNRLFSTPE